MKIEPDSKYYPVAKKLGELIRQYNEQQKPQTREEELADAERQFDDARALWEEKQARGELKDLETASKSCNTDEERASVIQEHQDALMIEAKTRRNPELYSLMEQFFDLLDQDGKLEGFMPPEVLKAYRKRRKRV